VCVRLRARVPCNAPGVATCPCAVQCSGCGYVPVCRAMLRVWLRARVLGSPRREPREYGSVSGEATRIPSARASGFQGSGRSSPPASDRCRGTQAQGCVCAATCPSAVQCSGCGYVPVCRAMLRVWLRVRVPCNAPGVATCPSAGDRSGCGFVPECWEARGVSRGNAATISTKPRVFPQLTLRACVVNGVFYPVGARPTPGDGCSPGSSRSR
jgi:hypothetical protein